MNLKNRTSCLFKIVLFIIFSIFVAEIIVLPKIEHDMLKEAGRQELVTVQQLCGAVLEKNPDVEQDFILGLRQPTKSWQENGRQYTVCRLHDCMEKLDGIFSDYHIFAPCNFTLIFLQYNPQQQ